MNEKNVTLKKWFNAGSKTEVIMKKAFVVLIAFYLMYKSGYVVGTFLANIGL